MNHQKITSFLQFQLPAMAWCLFIFTVSSIPGQKIPALFAYTDKLVHAGVFGVLCWLLHVAFYFQPNQTVRKWSKVIALGLTMLYGATDEFHQMFTPGRSTEFFDFVADSSGGAIYLILSFFFGFYAAPNDSVDTK